MIELSGVDLHVLLKEKKLMEGITSVLQNWTLLNRLFGSRVEDVKNAILNMIYA